MKTTWMVTGCGVTFWCNSPESAMDWAKEIISRGGVPEINEIKETL